MGTNYYHDKDVCPTCERPRETVHIGKSSAGWTFTWHGTDELRSCADWFAALQDGTIHDEYGHTVTLEDFRKRVNAKRGSPRNHAREYPKGNWLDPDGCSFSGHEFS